MKPQCTSEISYIKGYNFIQSLHKKGDTDFTDNQLINYPSQHLSDESISKMMLGAESGGESTCLLLRGGPLGWMCRSGLGGPLCGPAGRHRSCQTPFPPPFS